jgi:VanZ family protein
VSRDVWTWVGPAACGGLILGLALTPAGSAETSGDLVSRLAGWLALGERAEEVVHALLRTMGHVVAYGAFAVLVERAARATGWRRPVAFAVGVALALATLDESVQAFVPHRSGEVADVLLDLGGASTALAWLAHRRRATGSSGPAPAPRSPAPIPPAPGA